MRAAVEKSPSGPGVAVVLRHVSKQYRTAAGDVAALQNVSWTVQAGGAVAMMGPSGCGKTTLLNLLGGMDRPSGGSVVVDGVDLVSLGERELEKYRLRRVGFVFQFFNLIPSLSALENLELPMLFAGTAPEQRRARAASLLESVGMGPKARKRPEELSGGEQQRVAIALALVNDPPLILADEPTGNLDSTNSEAIASLLVGLARQHGKTVIVATHAPKVAEAFPRIYQMRDGIFVDGE